MWASSSIRRASLSVWDHSATHGNTSIILSWIPQRKTNIQPINLSGPTVLELRWTKQPRSFVSQQPGSGFGWMAMLLYIQQDWNVTGSAWPSNCFYFEKDPLPIQWGSGSTLSKSGYQKMDGSIWFLWFAPCMAVKSWQAYMYILDWSVKLVS